VALDAGRFLHPLFARLVRWEAQRIVRRFHRSLADPRHTQLRVLLEKLRRNADSDFGRRCSIAAVRSIEDFRRAVPITTYADYEPFIDRVRHGDSGAMFGPGQKLHMFAMTSGTAGRPKYIPVTGHFLREYRRGWMTWGIQAFLDHSEAFESRILQLVSPMDDETAPCGLPCGAMSGLTAHVQRKGARNIYVIPPAVARLKNTAQKYYVALLLALRCPRLIILSANPSTLLGLARALDEDKESLLRDLRDSRVSDSLDLPPDIRREIQRRLRPASRRVAELERHVVADGALLPRAAWQIPFLGCWKGGTLSLYLREFPRYFGGAVVRDIGLIASEGRMTVPLGDEGSAGVLDLESNFFEFVPARDGRRADDRALLPHELEVGGEYFLLITNSAGLYRYDIGDVVRVVDRQGNMPRLEFLNKGAHYSSLTGEKLSEHQVVEAVNRALADCGARLSSYALAPVWSEDAPHYVLIAEQGDLASGAAPRFAAAVDALLSGLNVEYNSKRSSGRLTALTVRLVAPGAWRDYDLRMIAERRRGIEQYKHKFLANDVQFERQFPALAEFDPPARPGPADERTAS